MLRPIVLFTALLLAPAACGSGGSQHSRSACEDLAEHEIELRLAELGNSGSDRLEQHRTNLQATVDDFVRVCQGDWSQSRIDCGLAASNVTDLQSCNPKR